MYDCGTSPAQCLKWAHVSMILSESAPTRRDILMGMTALGGVFAADAASSVTDSTVVSSAALGDSDIPASITRLTVLDRDGVMLAETGAAGLDPARRGSWWFTSNRERRFWKVLPQDVMSPEMFANVGDNVGDSVPGIASALEFVAANGVRTLRLRNGHTYRLESWTPGSDISNEAGKASIALPPAMRGVTIDLNGATLLQACDATTFGAKYRMFNDRTMRNMALRLRDLPRVGARQVVLASQANLGPGSLVMLVSASTVERVYAPIAEMLEISSVDGNTVSFETPVRKKHIATKAGPAALIDISDHHIRDCRLIGPGTVVNRYRRAGNVLQALGFDMDQIEAVGRGGFILRGRGIRVRGCSARIQANWSAPVYRPYAVGFDTGTSDASIAGFSGNGGDNVTFVHLHEALADITISGLTIVNGTTPARGGKYVGAISILSLSDNVRIEGVRIDNNPQGPAIEARSSQVLNGGNEGLHLRNIVVRGEFAGAALVVRDARPAALEAIDMRGARSGRGRPLLDLEGGPHHVTNVRLPPE
jgi:hypothetical protein